MLLGVFVITLNGFSCYKYLTNLISFSKISNIFFWIDVGFDFNKHGID
jgi:hypothetical protein